MRRLLLLSGEGSDTHCGEGTLRCEHAVWGAHAVCALFRDDLNKPTDGDLHPRRLASCRTAETDALRAIALKEERDLLLIEAIKAEREAGRAMQPGDTGVDALIRELHALRASKGERL